MTNIYNILKDYLNCSGELTLDIIEYISKCEFDTFEKTINRLYEQTSSEYIDPSHSEYTYDLSKANSQAEPYINYKEKYNPKLWNGVIQCIGSDNLVLKMFSIDSISELIQLNCSNRYLFVPILLSAPYGKDESKPNITCLILDNYTMEAYFFDPDGWTTFFDTDNYSSNVFAIEKIFIKYFEDLKTYTGTTYSFISSLQWNQLNSKLYSFELENYNQNRLLNGIITTLFCHYLSQTNKSVLECFSELENLNQTDKKKLYQNYILSFYEQLKLTQIQIGGDIEIPSNKLNESNVKQTNSFNLEYKQNICNSEQNNYISVKPNKKKVNMILDDFEEENY